MRALLQRVSHSKVTVDGEIIGKIGRGWLIFLGICHEDSQEDRAYLIRKIIALRAFNDDSDKMNLSLADIQGEALVVSQFTLFSDLRKGNRPSFTRSAAPQDAFAQYQSFIKDLEKAGFKVESGKFGAHMKVSLENDGPVTMLIDSKNKSL